LLHEIVLQQIRKGTTIAEGSLDSVNELLGLRVAKSGTDCTEASSRLISLPCDASPWPCYLTGVIPQRALSATKKWMPLEHQRQFITYIRKRKWNHDWTSSYFHSNVTPVLEEFQDFIFFHSTLNLLLHFREDEDALANYHIVERTDYVPKLHCAHTPISRIGFTACRSRSGVSRNEDYSCIFMRITPSPLSVEQKFGCILDPSTHRPSPRKTFANPMLQLIFGTEKNPPEGLCWIRVAEWFWAIHQEVKVCLPKDVAGLVSQFLFFPFRDFVYPFERQ